MRFKSIQLQTRKLKEQLAFYQDLLELPIIDQSIDSFSVRVGYSTLEFVEDANARIYHYCFLIPSTQIHQAAKWLSEKLDLIEIDGSTIVEQGIKWNASSVYFYDADGNIAECISRRDLKINSSEDFDSASFIGLNEIGLPTTDIRKTDEQLHESLRSDFWVGDYERFGTHGTQEALFLMVNPTIKNTWFPTNLKIENAPFSALLEIDGLDYQIDYDKKGVLAIKSSTS